MLYMSIVRFCAHIQEYIMKKQGIYLVYGNLVFVPFLFCYVSLLLSYLELEYVCKLCIINAMLYVIDVLYIIVSMLYVSTIIYMLTMSTFL